MTMSESIDSGAARLLMSKEEAKLDAENSTKVWPMCGPPNTEEQARADKVYHSMGVCTEKLQSGLEDEPQALMAWAFETKDSGERQEYTTGARRDVRNGKGRYDLLPPHAVQRLAQLFERGAVKYGEGNWEKGIPLSRFLDSALRHTFQVLDGATDEDHAISAAWNLLCFVETQARIQRGELPAELNDLG